MAPKVMKKLSKVQLFILLFARIVEPIAYSVLFPFVNQMMEDLLPDVPKESIGAYSGAIESVFSLTSFLCMYRWGRLSDKVGRKPVILGGLSGIVLSLLMFGVSKSYWWAMAARALSGALCGNASVIRAALGEIVDKDNEGWVYPCWSLCWDISVMIAPSMAGLTVYPATQYPNSWIAKIEFFQKNPYFLPCGIVALLSAIASVIVWLFLEETLEPVKSTQKQRDSSEPTEHTTLLESNPDYTGVVPASATEISPEDEAQVEYSAWQLVSLPAVKHVLISFFLIIIVSLSFDAVFVLFAYSEVKLGGLALTPSAIAQCLSIRGALSIVASLLFFPKAHKRWGTETLYRVFTACWVVIYLIPPVMNGLARNEVMGEVWLKDGHLVWLWTLMLPVLALYTFGDWVFPLNMLLVNAAAPNSQSLGALNGIALSIGSLSRAIGPTFIGVLYSLSAKYHAPIVWGLYAVIALASSIQCYWVRGEQKTQKDEEHEASPAEVDAGP